MESNIGFPPDSIMLLDNQPGYRTSPIYNTPDFLLISFFLFGHFPQQQAAHYARYSLLEQNAEYGGKGGCAREKSCAQRHGGAGVSETDGKEKGDLFITLELSRQTCEPPVRKTQSAKTNTQRDNSP
jgi:hypothetical protein